MRAVVVTANRQLECREVPNPTGPPINHLLIQIEAAAINHGDKAFLKMPATTTGLNTSKYDIWGASASGRVLAVGQEVSEAYVGKKVAIYRSLTPSGETIGLWSERTVVPVTSCLVLPEELSIADYSGSLVNMITAHAFLEEATSAGHTGVIVTVGGSGTGLALAALARLRKIAVLFLVRSQQAAESLHKLQLDNVLITTDANFDKEFERLASELKTTAVFDGVGGELVTRIAPHLPRNSTVWFYGFLAGADLVSVTSATYMVKNLTMKPFSNFNSDTVRDSNKLRAALEYLQGQITDPLFRTRVGKSFSLEQIQEAMAYELEPGEKAILLPQQQR